MNRSDCFRLERPLAGQDSHLLGGTAFPRRTNINNLSLPDWGNYAFNVHVGESAPKPITFSVVESRKLSKPAEETGLGD